MYLPALQKRDLKLMVEGSECDTGSDLTVGDWPIQRSPRNSLDSVGNLLQQWLEENSEIRHHQSPGSRNRPLIR